MMNLLEEILPGQRVGIAGHIRPDGDCIGAVMSLYHYLIKAVKDITVDLYLEEPSYIFGTIEDIDLLRYTAQEDIEYDVFILVDTNDTRIGHAEPLFRKAKKTINIDHHISNADGCAMVNHVEPETGSCCEVLTHLLDRRYFDTEIARELYTGMIHDTGIFQYSNTKPDTLRTAAELISYGFNFTKLIDETFYEKSFRQNKLLGKALDDATLYHDGEIIVARLPYEVLTSMGATPKTTDGIINQLRITHGVHCAMLIYGISDTENKISLRSDECVDVATVAEHFGGGGHTRAAGFNLTGAQDSCVEAVLKEIEKQL